MPMKRQGMGIAVLLLIVACGSGPERDDQGTVLPRCGPDDAPLELAGDVSAADERSYLLLPFLVPPGVDRIEVGYAWSAREPSDDPLMQTVFDLGLWDADGPFDAAGFRGWSGSRQGLIERGQEPVFVAAGDAERGYLPGPIEPGRWHVELGVAAVTPGGAEYRVIVSCLAAAAADAAQPAQPDLVPPDHVARDEPGWYHGDFHLHGHHSHPQAADWNTLVAEARAAGLDFAMLTEYVTSRHWSTLGAVQRAHPEFLLWPGREVITYFGHATVFGETPGVIEYRHGFEGISMADIQAASKEAGALFGIAHPTIFPGERFRRFCRGCEYELDDVTDFDQVDTIEVLTGPILVDSTALGLPGPARPMENPFVATAIDYWEDKLRRGHRITAVSGSDAKGVETGQERELRGYGSSVTAVYADALSRPALRAALEAGRAYVRTRGVAGSPELEMWAVTEEGDRHTFGASIRADQARLEVTVRGAMGQTLELIRNGERVATEAIDADAYDFVEVIGRSDDEGPLGTFWRVQTRDAVTLTSIGNPVFLSGPQP